MRLEARGLPAHTRALSVTLRSTPAARIAFAGYVLDLRKRGFVPVAGDLQGPGIIHQMELDGEIDPATLEYSRIESRMPTVPFEPTQATGGESCRDPARRVSGLAGTSLTEGYPRRLSSEIGGPRGCSHVLTLAHLLGPTAAWAIGEEQRLNPKRTAWRDGERIFRRDLVVEGAESDDDLYLTAQLTDMHFLPRPADADAITRFGAQLELRIAALLDLRTLTIREAQIGERRRAAGRAGEAPWVKRQDRADGLRGLSLRSGATGQIMAKFGEPGRDRPLLDAILMLAPTTIQCMASFIDAWATVASARQGAAETGGLPDSCYMWRRDGALGARRWPAGDPTTE